MKKNVHPNYTELEVTCSCGNNFKTKSTLAGADRLLKVEICSACHPAYGSNNEKVIDTSGRVEKFNRRFNSWTSPTAAANK